MTLQIVGAGLAGLLAANMLRHRSPEIIETQHALPNNHSAVLRFRTSAIGDAVNIPFKKVTMIKGHVPGPNLVQDALLYSFKNTGKFRSDRSINAGMVTADRWVAPPDLIQLMARNIKIKYGISFALQEELLSVWHPIISTMPMPTLMKLLNYPKREAFKFDSVPGINITAQIKNCDAYVSLLVPRLDDPISRISLTGKELIIECPNSQFEDRELARRIVDRACSYLGIPQDLVRDVVVHASKYAKINPVDNDARKDFIYWATDTHGIFSLGRFATWRPGLLLDDLVQDIRLIDKWLDKQDRYAIARAR